jgi:hypothetical protein
LVSGVVFVFVLAAGDVDVMSAELPSLDSLSPPPQASPPTPSATPNAILVEFQTKLRIVHFLPHR